MDLIVRRLRRKVFQDSLAVNQFLGKETGGGNHGQAAVLQFLGLQFGEFSRVFGLQAKRIESQVTRDVFLTQKTRLVNGDILGFDPADFGTDSFGLGNTGTQEEPEDGVDLGEVGDGRSRDFSVEKNGLAFDGFSNKETNSGKHGNASVGELGLTVSEDGDQNSVRICRPNKST